MPRTTPPPSIAPLNTLNSVSRRRVGEVHDLEPEARVGAVGPVAGDRIVVGDPRQRQLDLDPAGGEDVPPAVAR